MYRASADIMLPTSIIGSLPRPGWHTVSLGTKSFLEAMVLGMNAVRQELGIPEAECLAADQRYSLAAPSA